mmetsp:Transcript_15404/g.26030  ORF Transcript_15404/g.26030 Transcript_15404/m.26030 type:complete len:99 (-) Transcript_15404:2337-2633(-)
MQIACLLIDARVDLADLLLLLMEREGIKAVALTETNLTAISLLVVNMVRSKRVQDFCQVNLRAILSQLNCQPSVPFYTLSGGKVDRLFYVLPCPDLHD